jgi:hypothetical protein
LLDEHGIPPHDLTHTSATLEDVFSALATPSPTRDA